MRELTQIEAIPYRIKRGSIEYLVLKRTEEKGGFWQPVTGGVKEGETIEQARDRELKEELGEDAMPKKIISKVHYFEFGKPDRKNPEETLFVREYVFGVELPENCQIRLSDEHIESRWGGYEETRNLYRWDSNKDGLRKLNRILLSE